MTSFDSVSIVMPARNEGRSIGPIVARLRELMPQVEVLVVDDGSDDDTGARATAAGARVVRHPRSRGNGAAVKTGARAARGEVIVMMDADGQHDPADVPRLLQKVAEGNDLVIGARDAGSQASILRAFGNWLYNTLASWLVGHRVPDLTSGFRAARAERFREFLALYPNGFSYPTTSTMCFYRAGYGVDYVPIHAARRQGSSHIRLMVDGGRFLLIIFRVGTLYSPLKVFFPISLLFFLGGLGYSAWTITNLGRFTNFAALLFVTSILIFFIGLVSEQVTQLLYAQRGPDRPE